MNTIYFLTFSLTLLVLVDLHHTTELLDLRGTMRQKFLYAVTTIDERVSVVSSPFSALIPLGILLYATQENDPTQRELLKALGGHGLTEAVQNLKQIRDKIKRLPRCQTYIASKYYLSKKVTIKQSFLKSASKNFGIDCIGRFDASEAARIADTINKWVRDKTSGKIDRIISPGDVSPKAVLFVVDTIYFAAQWEHRFLPARSADFFGVSGTHTVQMMSITDRYKYGTSSALNAQAILIPYKGFVANMLVLLPNRRDGLSSLLSQLKRNPELINQIQMGEQLVELYLPKFRIETSLDLKVLYERVGLNNMFTDGYGLKNAVEKMAIKVDKGIHKTIIDVDELGTTAASASSLQGVASSRPNQHTVFKADHPFLFIIIAHKQQLFGGTFVG
ncbi:serpin (serine protease inhibitor) domain-containing protein [Phthorimaea operculella]|nr:serpin (serine protease inhibitor) domain-containing protein [Phthorimaea operculella]